MGAVKNIFQVNDGLDVWLKRTETVYVKYYREFVWQVFLRVLEKTPQYTGRAVANWNLGINSPDYSYEEGLGDEINPAAHSDARDDPHRKGHRKWIKYAIARNEPKVAQIQRNTKVYINNGVRGDDDGGKSSELYLVDLQDPAYWSQKLREENKPYETLKSTVEIMSRKILSSHGYEFKSGGESMGT